MSIKLSENTRKKRERIWYDLKWRIFKYKQQHNKKHLSSADIQNIVFDSKTKEDFK